MNATAFEPEPTQVGQILGASLVEGSPIDEVHPAESQLLQSAGISLRDYVSERFLLRACAAAYAIKYRLTSPIAAQVTAGFMNWFESNAARSPQVKDLLSVFNSRIHGYISAAQRDEMRGPQEVGALAFTEVEFAFGDNLLFMSSQGAAGEGACRALAMSVAGGYWAAQMEGSESLFARAKLLA